MSDLHPTPGQTVGPFFHTALPYERGNELVAPGTPGAIRLHGVVYDGGDVPVPDALVEIRQAAPDGQVPEIEGSLARDGRFTGWGRAATNADGRYLFTTLEPGAVSGAASFFAVTVFARGLLDRLFTRAYLPDTPAADLAAVAGERGDTLLARRDSDRDGDGSLRFDIRLQGAAETVFLTFPGHP